MHVHVRLHMILLCIVVFIMSDICYLHIYKLLVHARSLSSVHRLEHDVTMLSYRVADVYMQTGRQRAVVAIDNALDRGLASLKMVPVVAWVQLSGYKTGIRSLASFGCTWPARAPVLGPTLSVG